MGQRWVFQLCIQVAAISALVFMPARRIKEPLKMIGTKKSNLPDIPEALQEPGLKVPSTAWKWPRQFPFPNDGFDPVGFDNEKEDKEVVSKPLFDTEAAEALAGHYERHIISGAERVLVIDASASEESYIPSSSSGAEIWLPPANIEVVSLEAWNDGDAGTQFTTENYDAVILLHTAESLRSPRTAFREIWRILKPGGRAICAFTSLKASENTVHQAKVSKMWSQYDDAQRIWVVGSMFHFSSGAPAAAMDESNTRVVEEVWGAGWRALRGYEYLTSSTELSNPQAVVAEAFSSLTKSNTDQTKTPLFIIQADKASPASLGSGPTAALDTELWTATDMEEDDKRLAATRLLALMKSDIALSSWSIDDRERFASSCGIALRSIYQVLRPMSRVIATPLLAQLASNLAPKWNVKSKAQIAALKEGLGLTPPRETFWKPLGTLTAKLSVDDKLWLLADLLPFFDENRYITNEEDLPLALTPIVSDLLPAAINFLGPAVFPEFPDAKETVDCQLLATELIARDYLPDVIQATTIQEVQDAANRFKAWYPTLSKDELRQALDDRRSYRETAAEKAELAAIDPEAAAKKADDLRRALQVEAMLNEIARRSNQPIPTAP